MPAQQDLRSVGDQIEQKLEELRTSADPRSYHKTEELLRLVCELYGAGLARVIEVAESEAPGLADSLAKDDLVASLLLVHGLHPEGLPRRVESALAQVRPLLGAHGGDVELIDIDDQAGAVRLRLLGSCEGCPSSAVTLRLAVERAIVEAAPEIVIIDVVEPPPAGVPVTLGVKPVFEECPAEMAPS
jgi:Fe-S cluster biogenesis protein NfuA